MKKIFFFILVFFIPFFVQAQKMESEIIEQKGDTVFLENKFFTPNNKIYEIRFLREHRGRENRGKEDLFMRGNKNKYFIYLDSTRQYTYDEKWERTGSITLTGEDFKNKKNINYTRRDLIQEEFNVKSFLRIEAKSNTTLQKEIEVVNYLPQNSFLTILNKNKNIQTKGNKIELKSRKKNHLNLNVEIKSGVNNYKLILENFNNKKRRLNIETIGWDILASEFINESELKKSNCIAFNKGENIYIQSVENSKLLKIKRRKKIIEIPFSKAINKINTDSLKKGKYILEIINLGKNTSKFCKIKIK